MATSERQLELGHGWENPARRPGRAARGRLLVHLLQFRQGAFVLGVPRGVAAGALDAMSAAGGGAAEVMDVAGGVALAAGRDRFGVADHALHGLLLGRVRARR